MESISIKHARRKVAFLLERVLQCTVVVKRSKSAAIDVQIIKFLKVQDSVLIH